MSQAWQSKKERGSPFLMRMITWIALHAGRKPSRVILYPICFYFILFSPNTRRSSREFLTRALGRAARLGDIFRHYYYFASMLLDRVFFLSGRESLFETKDVNRQWFQDFVAQSKGCVLMGSHLGSFEMLRILGTKEQKLPLKVLMYKENAEKTNAIFSALNPEMVKSIIPIGGFESMFQVKASIDQGDIIGILADRVHSTDKAVVCQFFGRPARFPAGPILMASALKVPVVLCFGIYTGANRYTVYTELFAEEIIISRNNREKELQQWVQHYVDRLEYYCRKAPYNWFNLYDFWDMDP